MQNSFTIKGITIGEGRPVVCVPVVADHREGVIEDIRHFAKSGVEMIEWRVDHFNDLFHDDVISGILSSIADDLKETILLFTFRSKHQGGASDINEQRILQLNEIAAKSGVVDLLDLEFFEATNPKKEIKRFQDMGVKVIASHHDFDETPDDKIITMLLRQMQAGGADIVKLAVYPNSNEDVLRLLRDTDMIRKEFPGLPVVTMSMGKTGMVSRICGESFGSCITFGAGTLASAPGQLPYQKLMEILDILHESME